MRKEIPILFSTPMVKAILSGDKTQTRRIINPQPLFDDKCGYMFDGKHKRQFDIHNWQEPFLDAFSRWMPGDLLWVREAFTNGYNSSLDGNIGKEEKDWTQRYWVFKDGGQKYNTGEIFPGREKTNFPKGTKWKPSIHMPKDACRIWLEIISVRIERLKDISPGDACDEGVNYWNVDKDAFEGGELIADFENYMWRDDPKYEDVFFPSYANPVDSFFSLWEKINGRESLNLNPWVWVIEFKKVVKP